MSARGLRAATDRAQAEWAATIERVAGHHAARIARIDRERAQEELVALLRRETVNARDLGARQISDIIRAAGRRPAGFAPRTGVGPPAELRDRMIADWAAAEISDVDTATFRQGRLQRTIDQALTRAHDAGVADAIEGDDTVIGYRRVSRSGCCGACLALIDGRIHRNPRDFPRHPHCRCTAEPVVIDVNVRDSGRPTAQARWDAMTEDEQDAMFLGHGGQTKADLVRDGVVNLSDLMGQASRRPGEIQVVEEASTRALKELAVDRVDDAWSQQLAEVTDQARAAVVEWQRTDRTYALIQRIHRGGLEPPWSDDALAALAADVELDRLFSWMVAPEPMRVFRGIRNIEAALGAPVGAFLERDVWAMSGYTAGSLFRDVAVGEFLATATRGALIDIDVPAGTPAIWVAGLGARALRRQAELLLPSGVRLEPRGVRHHRGIVVLSTRVR